MNSRCSESAVAFPGIDGVIGLAGTLSLPPEGRSGPAVILVPGTGAIDRDVTFVGHALFRTLARAAKAPGTAFCVSLSGPLLSGTENAVRSFALFARGYLERDDEFDRYVSQMSTLLEIARSGVQSDRQAEAEDLAAKLAPRVINQRTEAIFGANRLSGPEFLRLLSSSCLDTSLNWDPGQVVPLITCPVLVLYGAKDVQAPGRENAAAARALVDELGKSD